MDRLAFYKSLFDREQGRRNELNNAINQPITLVTILIGLLYFLFGKEDYQNFTVLNFFILLILGISVVFLLLSITYLTLSFNNFLKGFEYKDFPKTKELFDYDIKVENFNSDPKNQNKQNFDNYLILKYVEYTDCFVAINDKRSLHLYIAKAFIIITLITEIIAIILISIKLI